MENKDKPVDKKLSIVKLRYEGNTYKDIATQIDLSQKQIGRIIKDFKDNGIEVFIQQKQTGNNRNLSFEAEKKVLDACMVEAEKGEILTAKIIQQRLEEEIGAEKQKHYVYRVLNRQGLNMRGKIYLSLHLNVI